MEKTANYQLNQWDAADPVSREDFNADNAAIDAALAEVKSQAAKGVDAALAEMETQAEQLADVAQTADRSMAVLRRMGYDLYQNAARSICAGVPGGSMKGAALNSLAGADELSRVSGMAPLSGGGCLLGPSTAMTLDKLNAALYDWESEEAKETSQPAAQRVKFKSAFAGTITSLGVWYYHLSEISTTLPVVVRLYDLESGACVYASTTFTSAKLTTLIVTETLAVSIPVEANHDYQLEVYTRGNTSFYGSIGFGTYGTQALTGTVTGTALTGGSVSETLTPEGSVSQVVAVIHHTGGQVTGAAVNGAAMTAAATRAGTSLRGAACTELELLWEGTLTGTAALTASFQSSATDMTIHDIQFFCV